MRLHFSLCHCEIGRGSRRKEGDEVTTNHAINGVASVAITGYVRETSVAGACDDRCFASTHFKAFRRFLPC